VSVLLSACLNYTTAGRILIKLGTDVTLRWSLTQTRTFEITAVGNTNMADARICEVILTLAPLNILY
jgi:hypothetical protein